VDRVTVFERGAKITRRAQLPAEGALPPRVIAAGLPLGLIDDSLRVTAKGAVATSATVILEAAGPDASLPEEVPAALREAKRAAALADGEVARLRREIEAVETSPLVVEQPAQRPPAPWREVAAARRALLELRQARLGELRAALFEAEAAAYEASCALAAAQDADRRATSARSARDGELRKSVVIELEAGGARAGDAVELSLEYAVRGARWAPSYVARFEDGQLTWTMRAMLAQNTGEDWRGVALSVSTAALDGKSELPELSALKIGRRQPPVHKRLRPPPPGVDELFADFDRDLRRRPSSPGAPSDPSGSAGPARAEVMLGGMQREELEGDALSASPSAPRDADNADAFLLGEMSRDDDTVVRAKKRKGAPAEAMKAMKTAVFSTRNASRSSPPPASAPSPMPMMAAGYGGARGGGGGVAPQGFYASDAGGAYASPAEPAPVELTAQLDYVGLVMAGPHHRLRGHLISMSVVERYRAGDGLDNDGVQRRLRRAGEAARDVERAAVPAGHHGDWSHDFDYAVLAEGTVDVPSDGGWHSLPVCTRSAAARVVHVAVPREASEVFRVATGDNPFDAPILPGPVDVYDRDRFLVTAEAPVAAPGGEVTLPLGVDSSIKVARNAEYREEVTGMLRGGLRLLHEVRFDIQNTSAQPIELEVRERVPVPRHKDSDDIAVEVTAVQPAWQAWTPPPSSPHQAIVRGGYRWKLTVPARGATKLSAAYEVRIAGKHELSGGNRREP
jgi:Domain of unknown function (DUF4139)/N-terminal domain of unknown function (DUF4140)